MRVLGCGSGGGVEAGKAFAEARGAESGDGCARVTVTGRVAVVGLGLGLGHDGYGNEAVVVCVRMLEQLQGSEGLRVSSDELGSWPLGQVIKMETPDKPPLWDFMVSMECKIPDPPAKLTLFWAIIYFSIIFTIKSYIESRICLSETKKNPMKAATSFYFFIRKKLHPKLHPCNFNLIFFNLLFSFDEDEFILTWLLTL